MIDDRPVWFSRAEVEALLDPARLVERVRAALVDVAADRAADPVPLRIDVPEHAANFVGFPSYWPAAGLAAVKVLSGAEGNAALGLPVIDAVLVVMEAATGRIRAIMDAASITALRTAAATALAVEALGPPPGMRLGLIGTGVQMAAHARVFGAVFDIASVQVASASDAAERAEAAAARIAAETGLAAGSVARTAAAAEADVLVVSSISASPLVVAGATRPNAIVASVGPFRPDATEIDERLVAGARRVIADRRSRFVDRWRGSEARLGRAFDAAEDLPAVLAARIAPDPAGVRVFLSSGRAIEDLAAAALVLETARERGVRGLALP